MRAFLLLAILLLITLVASALVSVPAYLLLQVIADIPFSKVITHTSSLFGLLFVFLYLKHTGCLNRKTAGFAAGTRPGSRDLAAGFITGVGIMLVLEVMLLGLGIHQPEPYPEVSLQDMSALFIKAIIAGLAVGLMEETIFRGALLGGLRLNAGTLPAVIGTSVVYAAVHFIKFPALDPAAGIHWYTGFVILAGAFERFANPVFIDMFLALAAFGLLLALVRLGKGNIYQCIGIHAGVVFTIKHISHLTDFNPGGSFLFLVNYYDHLLGYLAFAWLVILIIIYYLVLKKQSLKNA